MTTKKLRQQIAMWIVAFSFALNGCTSVGVQTGTNREPIASEQPSPQTTGNNVQGQQDWVARHKLEDDTWARKTGLAPAVVRKLRLMADAPDDSNELIDNLDAKGLQSRAHILLVMTGGNGHCLGLFVFTQQGTDFRQVWAESETPEGGGFCRASPHNPEAYVTQDEKIVVKIPNFDYARNATEPATIHTYTWNGTSYNLVGKGK